MNIGSSGSDRPAWFLGAYWASESEPDQTDRFVRDGIWENGYEDRYLDDVKSIHVGDRVAIKATYHKKRDLPFDGRGHRASFMTIRATGVVTENPGDGRRLRADWTPVDPPREWCFFTYRYTIWEVRPEHWMKDALLRFTFDGEPQDIDRFRNDEYWRDRFGDEPEERFAWTRYTTAIADQLLAYRDDRAPLVAALHEASTKLDRPLPLQDRFADGSEGPLRDICPFTVLGLVCRGLTDANRQAIATTLAEILGVTEPFPSVFSGIPFADSRRLWFFPFSRERPDDHIDSLWQVFSDALTYADGDYEAGRQRFVASFDDAIRRPVVSRRLTTGLFWVRPWSFVSLDGHVSRYVPDKYGIDVGGGRIDAEEYLGIRDRLESLFQEEGAVVNSFPKLSVVAYKGKYAELADPGSPVGDGDPTDLAPVGQPEGGGQPDPASDPYSIDDIIGDGCFLDRDRLETMVERLRSKKNLILQGPPGTGKTWLAKRLAYALIGSRSRSRVRPFQFHPNLSYEDFVRGWRPEEGGGLRLVDGPFLEAVEAAAGDPGDAYVLVIEEINRGNPAQIFGEMLTLLEADKRTPAEAIALSYPRHSGERVHIPPNLYVIGTMNVADRSLALVDFALRRRFAFVDLEPTFGEPWRKWVSGECDIDEAFLRDIEARLHALNEAIAADKVLGPQFRVGHSVVTPPPGVEIPDPQQWFRQVVETEIKPLLAEYWFDASERAESEGEQLLRGLKP